MNEILSPLALLEWYQTAGVDETIAFEPLNRLERTKNEVVSQSYLAPVLQTTPPLVTQTDIVSVPQTLVRAETLDDLKQELLDLTTCSLKQTAKNMVFADGNPQAELMIIGEAPGEQEDIQGLPFVGASGRLLDLMLDSIGYSRKNVYISNVIPWRPPANRKPTLTEIALLTPFIKRHILLCNPKILFLLGGSAVSALLNTQEGISKVRGKILNYQDLDIPVVASFHPAFLLRSPLQKKMAWRDLLLLKQILEKDKKSS